jgi:membrane fusion protein (multidrug efflux system)
VSYNPYGATAYIVVPQDKQAGKDQPAAKDQPAGAGALVVKQVFVTTGATRGDQVAILKGVSVGDRVVTSGQIKLKNGASVVIDNSVQPSDDPNPKPQEQ